MKPVQRKPQASNEVYTPRPPAVILKFSDGRRGSSRNSSLKSEESSLARALNSKFQLLAPTFSIRFGFDFTKVAK
jgi:hypothetical protein